MKRTLEADEKKQIVEACRLNEIAAHPDKMIAVQVDDETDDAGEPIIRINHIGKGNRPKGWRPAVRHV